MFFHFSSIISICRYRWCLTQCLVTVVKEWRKCWHCCNLTLDANCGFHCKLPDYSAFWHLPMWLYTNSKAYRIVTELAIAWLCYYWYWHILSNKVDIQSLVWFLNPGCQILMGENMLICIQSVYMHYISLIYHLVNDSVKYVYNSRHCNQQNGLDSWCKYSMLLRWHY